MKDFYDKIKAATLHVPELIIIFLSPVWAQVGIITLAVFTDTATAIWAAKRSDEAVTSKKAATIVSKLTVYYLVILLSRGMDCMAGTDYVLKLISLALLGMELMSIDENFKKATGKSIFKPLIDKVRRK